MNKLRTIYSGMGLSIGLVLVLSASVTAVTVSGYFLNFGAHAALLTGGGSVPSNVDVDTAWLTNSNTKFAVINGQYTGIAQGTDNFVLNVTGNTTLGYSAEADITLIDCPNPPYTSCGSNGYGGDVKPHGITFSILKQTTNATVVYSDPCGSNYVPYDSSATSGGIGTVSAHVVALLSPPTSTNQWTFAGNNFQGCTITCGSCTTNTNWPVDQFGSNSGLMTVETSGWIWNPNDGHTFDLQGTNKTAAEFDQGLKDFASGLGFKTPASQTFFTLLAIGLSEVAMAFFTGFFGEGKWRLWAIHGVASTVGVICVLLGYTQFWIVLVAMVLATTVVSGGRESINTFKALAKAGAKYAAERIRARSGAIPEGADAEVLGGSVEEVEERADKTEEDKEVEQESNEVEESVVEEESEIDDDGSEDSP